MLRRIIDALGLDDIWLDCDIWAVLVLGIAALLFIGSLTGPG